MNKVILAGRLGADAELRVTTNGANVCKFSLATSEKYTDKQGAKQERTEWHRCNLWGDRASKIAQHLTKGKQLLVEGSIQYSSYEKDGEKRYSTDIRVDKVEFLGGKNDKAGGEPASEPEEAPAAGDEEIPF